MKFSKRLFNRLFTLYTRSFTHKLGIGIGLLVYLAYSFKDKQFKNPYIIGVSLFMMIILPYYGNFSDKIEEKAKEKTGKVFVGRLARFIPQMLFNYGIIYLLILGKIINTADLDFVHGIWGAAAMTTGASQGMQYVAIELGGRCIGFQPYNVAIALSFNMALSALAALGFRYAQIVFLIVGFIFTFIGVVYSLLTDIKAMIAPKGGIGVYFGTFNPVHVSHLALMRKIIEERKLEKLYVHPNTIPMLHAKMLKEKKIRIKEYKHGMRIYEKTETADPFMDLLPTGNVFLEYQNRYIILKAAIKDLKMDDKVEVVCYPEVYSKAGFWGVFGKIKEMNKGKRFHGLHGSDMGGMMMRNVYDDCLTIWPFTVIRRDNISGTAVREGAKSMTTESVTKIFDFLRNPDTKKGDILNIHGINYRYNEPILEELPIPSPQLEVVKNTSA